MTARDEVLARIDAALGSEGTSPDGCFVTDQYRTCGDLRGPDLLDLLASRLADYRAIVRRATPATLAAEISAALTERGARRLVVPPGLNLELPRSAAVAIAETGTIVLDGSPGQGRRAITLVPDYHLCVVEASQVVHLVPEAVARLANAAGSPLTWISGPSATSDIELERVEGVHGPRTLEVVLVAD